MNKLRSAMLLALLTLGLAVSNAEAGSITLRLTASGGTGGTTGDITLLPNQTQYTGTVGSFTVLVSLGTSNNPGNPSFANIRISEATITNTTPLIGTVDTTLEILLSQTDFTAPAGPSLALDSSATANFNNAPSGDEVEFTSYIDDSNTLFGTAIASPTVTLTVPSCSPLPGCTVALSGNAAVTYVAVTPTFSLTNRTIVTLSPGSIELAGSGSTVVSQVPEPTSLVLLGFGLLGAGFARRRKSVS